jgi:hypothetical protein
VIPSDLVNCTNLLVNGTNVVVRRFGERNTAMYYVGQRNLLRNGLNWLMPSNGAPSLFWYEENELKQFDMPYSTSYAIVVAIDDYARTNDPEHRVPTGYSHISFMVQNAHELALTLEDLGFPRQHILELYNTNATSGAIDDALYKFWKGGEFAGAGRLFFYFGGHGQTYDATGCLITYDFDKSRPTRTSLLMDDLTGRHFKNVLAHHMLVTIDSCYAGLAIAIPQVLTTHPDAPRTIVPKSLNLIQIETRKPTKAVMVSSSSDEQSLYENGGIFTRALIAGLKGEADTDGDGLIQLDELGPYVREQVAATAKKTGVDQIADWWSTHGHEKGEFIFLRNAKPPGN